MIRRIFTIGLALAILSIAGWAQVLTGRMQGTVTDSQGAVIPGAEIKVANTDNGQTFDTLSNELGTWALPSMSTGVYKVAISLPGFKTVTIENVKVDAAVPATVNAKLEVGSVTETVQVESGAEVLQ